MLKLLSSGHVGLTPNALKKALLSRGEEQEHLFRVARTVRDEQFPARVVEMRSVIEIGNRCRQRCQFCAMGTIPHYRRYRIDPEALLKVVSYAYQRGRRVIMLQSGESTSQKFVDQLSASLREIKQRYPDLEIILCLGGLKPKQFKQLRVAGADRYILKFETSCHDLYRTIKPRDTLSNRLATLSLLNMLGYQVGSGSIVGLPGQTLDHLVEDLLLVTNQQWPMVSASVFIPGRGTSYADEPAGDVDLTLNVMALLRILVPKAYIPTTSSLERLQTGGQLRGLMAGANTVTVHDGTPRMYREDFPIYSEGRFTPDEQHLSEIVRSARLGIPVGEGKEEVIRDSV